MPRWLLLGLRPRLVALVLLAVLPALALVLVSGLQARQAAAEQAQLEALRLVRSAITSQNQQIEGTKQLLTALAQLPQVQAADPTACNLLFEALLRQYPQYSVLGTISTAGIAQCSAPATTGTVSLADRPYFQKALATGEFAIGDYQIGRISKKPSVNFGFPIHDAASVVSGVVYAGLHLGTLASYAQQLQLPTGASLVMRDRTNTILVSYPDTSQVGQVDTDSFIARTTQGITHEGTAQGPDRAGQDELFAFAPVRTAGADSNVILSIGIPTSVAYAQANRALAQNLAGIGLVALLALVAAWLGGNAFVLRPIGVLLATTRRLSAGDYRARTNRSVGGGELGELAAAVDEMAEQLTAQITATQQRESSLRDQNAQLQQLIELVQTLETPVIPLLEGVLVVPLVGHLDAKRGAAITDVVLQTAHVQRARTVILDMTGMAVVDAVTLDTLQHIAAALQLLGARVIVTGITAQVAGRMGAAGVTLDGIQTTSRLQDGMAMILSERAASQR